MEQLKYNGKIITDGENADIDDTININDIDAGNIFRFDYEKAIRRKAKELAKNEGASIYQKEKELEERYKNSIKAMQKIRENIIRYKDLSEAEINLDDLIFALRESGLYSDRSIQKISNNIMMKMKDNKSKSRSEIEDNIDKTKGLPVTSGFVKTFIIDEQTGIKEKYYKSFSLYQGVVEMDVGMLEDFCRDTMQITDVRNHNKTREVSNREKVIDYAIKRGITQEDALEESNKEDKENKLGRKYAKELDDIEVIRSVLKMPITEEIKSEFSQKQITQYGVAKIESGVDLQRYEKKFDEVSKYEKDIIESRKVLESLFKMKESEIDSKQKAKLIKRIQKLILKQEKRLNKEKIKLGKIKQSKSLSRYFGNIDKYRQLTEAYKRYTAKSFGRYSDLNESFEKNGIEENEIVNVGPVDEKQLQQDKEFIERMFRAEINSVIMKDKKPMTLPEATKEIKSDRTLFAERIHHDTSDVKPNKYEMIEPSKQEVLKTEPTEGKVPGGD